MLRASRSTSLLGLLDKSKTKIMNLKDEFIWGFFIYAFMPSSFSNVQLCNPMDCSPPGSSVHGILQAKNTGVVCHALLQGIFPIQRSNQHLLYLLHWQAGSLPLAPPGKYINAMLCYAKSLQSCPTLYNPTDNSPNDTIYKN